MFRRALVGAALLVVLMAAPAAAQYQPNTVTPGSGVAGTEITVAGSGCAPFQDIEITVYPETQSTLAGIPDSAPVITVNTTSDADGNYNVSFTVPAGLAPGWYDILGPCPKRVDIDIDRANGEKLYFLGRFLVVAPGAPGGNQGGGVDLPRTGSDLNSLGLIGAGLLVAGGLVLTATTSRRRSAA